MKRADLRRLIKPMVKECVRETLLEEGLLSNIVSEVAQGLGNQEVIREMKEERPRQRSVDNSARITEMKNQKKQLLDAIGKDSYNGVDLFEGTTPLKSGGSPSAATPSQGPFSGVDPSDPGVDIGSLTESLGGVWKKLAQGNKR